MSSQPKCLKLLITTDIFDHSLPTLFFSYSFFYKASPQIVALNIVNPSIEWWPSDLCDTHRRSDVLKLQKQYLGLSLGNNVQYFFFVPTTSKAETHYVSANRGQQKVS